MRLTRKITPGYLNRQRRLFRDAEVICIDANLSATALQTIFRLAGKYGVPVCADPTTALLATRTSRSATGVASGPRTVARPISTAPLPTLPA